MIVIQHQIVVWEDDYSVAVTEAQWAFATILQNIAIADRKVSKIKLFRIAFPDMSLRDSKMIVEAAEIAE